MARVVYVDLSAKVEHWTKASAVAVSNDHARVYLVTGKVKQKARALIRELYGGKSERYRLLAVFIYLAVREELQSLHHIVIDKDYRGSQAEATIKNLLLRLLRKDRPDATAGMIRFAEVKGTTADRLAKQVYDGDAEPDRIVMYSEIEALIGGFRKAGEVS